MRTIIPRQYECKKCGHRWLPRLAQRPAVCPKCKSTRWYRPTIHEDKEGK